MTRGQTFMTNNSNQLDRRSILKRGAAAVTALGLSPAIPPMFLPANTCASPVTAKGDSTMNTVKTKDGAEIHYRDWGPGRRLSLATVGPYRPTRGRDRCSSSLSAATG